jgi:hypothetical protein
MKVLLADDDRVLTTLLSGGGRTGSEDRRAQSDPGRAEIPK